jgi:uncharacterized repeat protein (TIGR01451 family)
MNSRLALTPTIKGLALVSAALICVLVPTRAARSSTTEQAPGMTQPCGAGFAYGDIEGVPTCMHRGLSCKRRNDSAYHPFGFNCRTGRLRERHPFPRRADLSVTNIDSPDPVRVGDNLTYSVTIGNHGPGRAFAVYLFDGLGLEGVTVDYVSSTASQGICSEREGQVFCHLGDIAKGEAARVTIIVRVLPRAPSVKTNWGFAESGRLDPYFRNNIASIKTAVTRSN